MVLFLEKQPWWLAEHEPWHEPRDLRRLFKKCSSKTSQNILRKYVSLNVKST